MPSEARQREGKKWCKHFCLPLSRQLITPVGCVDKAGSAGHVGASFSALRERSSDWSSAIIAFSESASSRAEHAVLCKTKAFLAVLQNEMCSKLPIPCEITFPHSVGSLDQCTVSHRNDRTDPHCLDAYKGKSGFTLTSKICFKGCRKEKKKRIVCKVHLLHDILIQHSWAFSNDIYKRHVQANSVKVKIEAVPMRTNMWELFVGFSVCVYAVPMAKPELLCQAVFLREMDICLKYCWKKGVLPLLRNELAFWENFLFCLSDLVALFLCTVLYIIHRWYYT